ncbi:hypothetical protein IWX90DRAFT_141177 [Phyllosticta citrichinensis]|uniref:GST N-terminal domain-containing protein n=1 Tax=Phyllosticta citrichinensis TaxID=1130410 RepID=A0ABR1XYN2_9PEZI
MSDEGIPIILFCYPGSVFARRVSWYLDLRKISYRVCIQPNRLPRPELSDRLNIKHRRIPILAIGRDVYCDTRLIIRKLDQLFPPSPVYPGLRVLSASDHGLAALLENWTVDGGVFWRATQLIPPNSPLAQDDATLRDREEFTGRKADTGDDWAATRQFAMVQLETSLRFLETTMLADGRDWLAKSYMDGPSVADIHGVWVFDWLLHDASMSGAVSGEERERWQTRYPKTWAWLQRWRRFLADNHCWEAEKEKHSRQIDGEKAAELMEMAGFAEQVKVKEIDEKVAGVNRGDVVEVWPTDSGFTHHDKGTLVGLTPEEVVVEVETETGEEIQLHFPRVNFRAEKSAE